MKVAYKNLYKRFILELAELLINFIDKLPDDSNDLPLNVNKDESIKYIKAKKQRPLKLD